MWSVGQMRSANRAAPGMFGPGSYIPKDRSITTGFGVIVDNFVKPSAQCLVAVTRANKILEYAESVLGYKCGFIVSL